MCLVLVSPSGTVKTSSIVVRKPECPLYQELNLLSLHVRLYYNPLGSSQFTQRDLQLYLSYKDGAALQLTALISQ